MQTYSLSPLSALSDELNKVENNKLSIILSRLVSGNNEVLVTPVGERVGPQELFMAWSKIYDANTDKVNSVLNEIEENQKAKFGPRSRALPWDDIKDTFFDGYNASTNSCEHIRSEPPFSLDKGILRPASITTVIRRLKLSTNSGLPYLSNTGSALDKILNNLDRDYNKNWPMVPFIRTQEDYKTRLVKGYPKSDVIIESMYFYPLFEYYRQLPCYAAMNGPEEVNKAMTKLISEAVRLGHSCVSGDISNFDDSFGIPLQTKCFDEMKFLIQREYHKQFEEIAYRFGHKEMVIPEGIVSGPHGIPSGSQFTNLIGSIGNRKVCDLPLELTQFLGDDFAVVAPNPDDLFDKYQSCGLDLNKDKTDVSDSYFVYLQNLFHPDYVRDGEIKGVYPTWRALNRLIYPERFSSFHKFDLEGKDYFAIRSLSILENCKYHPLFEELVKFWISYEKYAVPSELSISKYAKYLASTSGSLGTMNQFGSDVRGLTNFESFKLALKYS